MKKCTNKECQVNPEQLEFYSRADGKKPFIQSQCKVCVRGSNAMRRQKHRAINPNWQREVDLKHNFGISMTEWNTMFDSQQGKCAICFRHQSELNKNLRVDHNHQTGVIRGLLCATCNSGIGMLQDNAEILQNAYNYLNNQPLKPELADIKSNVLALANKKRG